MNNSDTFLTTTEVAELSGISRGSGGKHKSVCQSEQLAIMRVHHYINARNLVIVPRTCIEQKSSDRVAVIGPRPGMNIDAIK